MSENFPNLFIVGAAKAGTTALVGYLKNSKDVFFPNPKEPHFFCYEEYKRLYYYKQPIIGDLGHYLNLYKRSMNYKIRGDATVHYLPSHEAPLLIKKYAPKSKIIILLRDPIERAFSHYLMDLRSGLINVPMEKIIAEKEKYPKHFHEYIELGMYKRQVERYIDIFGRDKILIGVSEKFKESTDEFMHNVVEFLEIEKFQFSPNADDENRFRMPNFYLAPFYKNFLIRTWLSNNVPDWIRSRIKARFFNFNKPKMNEDLRGYLKLLYEGDVRALEGCLGHEIEAWKVKSE